MVLWSYWNFQESTQESAMPRKHPLASSEQPCNRRVWLLWHLWHVQFSQIGITVVVLSVRICKAFSNFSGVQSWSFPVVRHPLCDTCILHIFTVVLFVSTFISHAKYFYFWFYWNWSVVCNGVIFFFYHFLRFLHFHSRNANKLKIKTVSEKKSFFFWVS